MDRVRIPLAMDTAGMVDEAMNVDYERLMDAAPWAATARRVMRETTEARGSRPRDLLDLACGPSHLLVALARSAPYVELHGVDLSEHMLALAARRLAKAGVTDRVALHRGSVYELPFADSSFDAIVCTDALHCFDDPRRLFSEAVRVARPGGVVVVHGWRRDMPLLLGGAARAHTWVLRHTGSHLEGGGPILDASWTSGEILEAVRGIPGAEASVKDGLFEMVVSVRKAALA